MFINLLSELLKHIQKMEKLFEGKTCIAEYNREKQRIRYTFDGYANIDEHKAMYQKAMAFLANNKTTAFLFDFRNMKGTFTMLNDFVVQLFRPAVEQGLKKSAMVLNNDVFTAFSSDDAIKKISLIQVQVFKEINEAETWCDE